MGWGWVWGIVSWIGDIGYKGLWVYIGVGAAGKAEGVEE